MPRDLHDKCIATLKASKVTCIRLTLDEAHKAYAGSSNKPARIAAWRKALAEEGIALVVTAVTATPLWDKKSKVRVRLAKRACTVLGLEVGEGETAVWVLNDNMVAVSPEDAAAIFAVTRPLQTAAPEKFERRELAIPGGSNNGSPNLRDPLRHQRAAQKCPRCSQASSICSTIPQTGTRPKAIWTC